jgi:hypothetical protein
LVTIYTSSPSQLLKQFMHAIDQGHIVTWKYFRDGDFTHTPAQWASRAYMRPSLETGKLKFQIIKTPSSNVSVPVYAIYHGRLIESFLEHFDRSLSDASATALPFAGDVVS